MKRGYVGNLEEQTAANADFRKVMYTGEHLQLVLMTLQPGDEIGEEVHDDRDQFFRFEGGTGIVTIDGTGNKVEDGSGVIVPSGARHNVINNGGTELKLYSIYGPPEHMDKIVQPTKAEADKRHPHEEWDGKTSE